MIKHYIFYEAYVGKKASWVIKNIGIYDQADT